MPSSTMNFVDTGLRSWNIDQLSPTTATGQELKRRGIGVIVTDDPMREMTVYALRR